MPPTHEETLKSGRILLVDDDVGALCLLENMLNRLGFSHLRKLDQSIRILTETDDFQPDLVITDIDMPALDGIQVIEQLRAHLPLDGELPILVLTGVSDKHIMRKALVAGATDILEKPLDPSEILMHIRNLLRTRFQHLEIQSQNRILEEKVRNRTGELEEALTALKESQRQVVQQERFRAFGEMAGGIVHDFNNALMSVIGYSELLLNDDTLLDDRAVVRDYLSTMNTAGRDASQVVSRLRDFYRPREEGDVFAAIDVNRILEEAVPLTRPKWHDHALETGRSISIEFELDKVPLVLGNGAELREVFTNLIFNAVDAMPAGGAITLRTKSVGESVEIEVVDTGSGMSEEVMARCLEPFFSTKGEQGTGLGLAMVFGIVRRHEGTLEIESATNRGTTIRLRLPAHRHLVAGKEEANLTLDHTLNVLVVDDDAKARDVVTQFLKSDNHRVVAVSSGKEAMQRVMADDFDLVITDLGMPGMTGRHVSEAIRRIDANKPVILMTGFEIEAEKDPMPIVCVLKKPLVLGELRSAIRKAMGPGPRGRDQHTPGDITKEAA